MAIANLGRHGHGFAFVQGPRQVTLFGRRGASGFTHEVDTGVQAATWVAMLEAKAMIAGPRKNDALIFDAKTFDLYVDRLIAHRPGPHYRLFASTGAMQPEFSAFSAQRGIICIEPELLPLPVVLAALARPVADELFSDSEMQEADRLFSQACLPMEEIWQRDRDELRIALRRFRVSDANDLGYLHHLISGQLIEYLDSVEPSWAQDRAKILAHRSPELAALLGAA